MKIGIGAITRRRPEMFQKLLDSFASMQRPDGAELVVIIVENDGAKSLEDRIVQFRENTDLSVVYELEKTPGIPFARNKVLDLAFEHNCDLMTFADDDEFVDEDWLTKIFAAIQERNLDLVGGPIRQIPESDDLGYWQKQVQAFKDKALKERHKRCLESLQTGTDGEMNVYTHNWCVRLSAAEKYNLRFDPSLMQSGGEDTKFCSDMREAGGLIGWAPDAWITETVPLKRLSLRYFYQRNRDLTMLNYHFKPKPRSKMFVRTLERCLETVLTLIAAPFKGPSYVVKAVRKMALTAGTAMALFGTKSKHYKV